MKQYKKVLWLSVFGVVAFALSAHPRPSQAAGTNLIQNSSLETPSQADPTVPNGWHKGFWGTNQPSFTYPVAGIDGVKAAKITLNQRSSGDAKWYFDPVAVASGETYTFKDQYQSNVPTILTIEYRTVNNTLTYADLKTLPPSPGAWAQSTASFVIPANVASLTVFHLINQVGNVTVDNFSLIKNELIPPLPPPGSDNLIPNADLSVAAPLDPTLPAYWHHGGWGTNQRTLTYPVSGYNGLRGLQTKITSYLNGDAKWYFDPVPVTPGDQYEYVDYYQSTVPTFVTAQYTMQNGSFTYADIAFPSVATAWTRSSARFTIPSGATHVTIFHLLNRTGTLTTSAFALKKLPSATLSQGMVTFTFDDGFQSIYDHARPILDTAGFKPTLFMVSNFLNEPDYMTTAQMLEMNRNGYEIGAHSRNHEDLTLLTSTRLQQEVLGSKNDLLALGTTPVTTFAYPYGAYNDQVVQAVRDAGFVGARSVNSGFNDRNSDPYLLMDQHVESNVTPSQINAWIDQAVAESKWLILELHDQNANGDQWSNSPATLQAVVDYLKQKNVRVVTLSQGLQIIRQ